jgi:hypothetical protein
MVPACNERRNLGKAAAANQHPGHLLEPG